MKYAPLFLLGVLIGGPGRATGSELTLQQLNHRSFSAAEGAPSDIKAIAQTTDGTLWLGSVEGLWRFDGQRFVGYPEPSDEPLPSTAALALTASTDGGLWIGFRSGGVGLLKRGHLTRYTEREGVPDGTVRQFAWDRDGGLWVATAGGLARLRESHWERIASDSIRTTRAIFVDRMGILWVATDEGVLAKAAGENRFREVAKVILPFQHFYPVLTSSPDGKVWTVAEGAVTRMDAPMGAEPGDTRTLRVSGAGPPLMFDDEGNLWLGRASLHRLRVPEVIAKRELPETIARFEEFGRADGLSSGFVESLFQDHEKNIWVGTKTGLDRFSRTNVVRVPLPWCSGANVLAAGENGSLWVACPRYGSSTGSLTEIRNGSVVSHQDTEQFTAGYGDTEGNVWFGGPRALGHLEGHQIVAAPVPEQAAGPEFQALARDRAGAIWVSVVGKGTFRVIDGRWSAYGDLDALPRKSASVEATDASGNVWFGYWDNLIARVNGRAVQLLDTSDGLHVGNVTAIYAQGGQVWVAGELGFARFDGAHFVPVLGPTGAPFRGISGIVGTKNGDLWLNAVGGITHIERQEVERFIHDASHRVQCETFDYLDGVPGGPVQVRPVPSAVETTDDRLWFGMSGGVVSIDTTRLVHNVLPPPVTIWSIKSGARRFRSQGADLHLPIHTTTLQIDYTAGSLTIPERVHFRYKLEGSDDEWQDVSNRREALYTNLGPGRYSFRVIASNNDGVWNNTGASVNFTIDPAFYQTRWFYTACVLASIGLLYFLYRLRMRQVGAQVKSRLEVRLAERERIARELHDTLLQGVQGLIWRFQAVADRISHNETVVADLVEQALERADQVLEEGRERVKDLRGGTSDTADLVQAIAIEGEQLALGHSARFRASVEGVHRNLHPIVREEAVLITREALSNAFRHAGAQNIEAEVSYGDAALHVRIRDNGCGIGVDVLKGGGQPGHFGLLGMHERAEKMRAHLDIWSKPGAGTEIDLQVPADVAYQRSRGPSRGSWWRVGRSVGGTRSNSRNRGQE